MPLDADQVSGQPLEAYAMKPSKQVVIGVGYKKRRGKDELTRMLISKAECRGFRAQRVSFADDVKDVCYLLASRYGVSGKSHYDRYPEDREAPLDIGKSARDIWIGVGDGLRHIICDQIWIDRAKDKLRGYPFSVISDVGYLNEARMVKELGGFLVRVDREGPMAADPRETQLDTWTQWDWVVDNNGDLDSLELKADQIIQEVLR